MARVGGQALWTLALNRAGASARRGSGWRMRCRRRPGSVNVRAHVLRGQALMREVNVGEKLDQYELTELIARSGMASIFKAADRLNGGVTVAIKVPYQQFESDVVFYSRFEREEQ